MFQNWVCMSTVAYLLCLFNAFSLKAAVIHWRYCHSNILTHNGTVSNYLSSYFTRVTDVRGHAMHLVMLKLQFPPSYSKLPKFINYRPILLLCGQIERIRSWGREWETAEAEVGFLQLLAVLLQCASGNLQFLVPPYRSICLSASYFLSLLLVFR